MFIFQLVLRHERDTLADFAEVLGLDLDAERFENSPSRWR